MGGKNWAIRLQFQESRDKINGKGGSIVRLRAVGKKGLVSQQKKG